MWSEVALVRELQQQLVPQLHLVADAAEAEAGLHREPRLRGAQGVEANAEAHLVDVADAVGDELQELLALHVLQLDGVAVLDGQADGARLVLEVGVELCPMGGREYDKFVPSERWALAFGECGALLSIWSAAEGWAP